MIISRKPLSPTGYLLILILWYGILIYGIVSFLRRFIQISRDIREIKETLQASGTPPAS